MLIFVKLGGSLITDKQVEYSYRGDVMARLAREISVALRARRDLQLILGHGSGSFGHVAAKRFGTMEGVQTAKQWRGFAQVATVASQLSQLVANTLHEGGVPAWRLQPSASAKSEDGVLKEMAVDPIRESLLRGLVPLVHGDVSLDTVRGGTIISTETIFTFLAYHLPVSQILLVGEVEGVYDSEGKVIPEITLSNYEQFQSAFGGSAGTDVTGGMETKVKDMLALVRARRQLQISIIDGTKPGLLEHTLLGTVRSGTHIHA